MQKTCARCFKVVYPTEELNCLDKVWHKTCFKCTTCGKTLNMVSFRSFQKFPYCEAHNPGWNPFANIPELKRLAENSKVPREHFENSETISTMANECRREVGGCDESFQMSTGQPEIRKKPPPPIAPKPHRMQLQLSATSVNVGLQNSPAPLPSPDHHSQQPQSGFQDPTAPTKKCSDLHNVIVQSSSYPNGNAKQLLHEEENIEDSMHQLKYIDALSDGDCSATSVCTVIERKPEGGQIILSNSLEDMTREQSNVATTADAGAIDGGQISTPSSYQLIVNTTAIAGTIDGGFATPVNQNNAATSQHQLNETTAADAGNIDGSFGLPVNQNNASPSQYQETMLEVSEKEQKQVFDPQQMPCKEEDQALSKPLPSVYRAVCDFNALDNYDVSFLAGDIIHLVGTLGSEWIVGRVERTDQTGDIPASFVRPI